MPKNTKGGKRHKRSRGFSTADRKPHDIAKDAKDGQLYGLVMKAVGNRRFIVKCQAKTDEDPYLEVNCGLKGSYTKTIKAGQYVLLQDWQFERNAQPRGTIIDGYTDNEVKKMDTHGLWDYNDVKVKKKEDLFEFISEKDAAERDLEREKADERLGPKNITQMEDEDDIDAI